jgi:hypothetical protein
MATVKRQRSLFWVAAWLSLLAPVITLAVVVVISSLSGHVSFLPSPSRQFSGNLHGSALLIDFGSLVLGIFSLFGIRRHGAAFILWKAVPGILASGTFGFYHFVMTMMSSIIC